MPHVPPSAEAPPRLLVFGAGFLGRALLARRPDAVHDTADIADERAVRDAFERHAPTHVVNAAAKTGRPNVDALEGRAGEVLRSNVAGPLLLARVAAEAGVHLTHFSSGCLYTGDRGGAGYREDDPPNFRGSLYARSKALAEMCLAEFDVLQVRLRMPVSSEPHPRNLITKLMGFRRVMSVPNSVTVLDDAWPVLDALIERRVTGLLNLVNPGIERHDEVLAAIRERVDPEIRFEVVPADVVLAGMVAGRSNCILSTGRLARLGLEPPPFDVSLPRVLDRYAISWRAAREAGPRPAEGGG